MGLHFTAKINSFATGVRQTKNMSTGKSYKGYCLNYLTPNSYLDMCVRRMLIRNVNPGQGCFEVETDIVNLNLSIIE